MDDRSCYEPCSRCGGYGLIDGLYGPRDCPECRGDCLVRARVARGRFTTVPITRPPETP